MENKQLGQFLRDLRKSFGYKQEYVASALDVSRQAYSHYETGRGIPSNEALYKIAGLYNIPLETLIEKSVVSDIPSNYGGQSLEEDEVAKFLHFLNSKENILRLKYLSRREKELLYYFNDLSVKDQSEIIAFIKVKLHNLS
ncbi:MAG: helix-turn-helix transcriptional regulator [Lachnospiraceae bacterium]|nr:helix-turn-helix transcriptional regulator [Lachnospiraceae bacterium]